MAALPAPSLDNTFETDSTYNGRAVTYFRKKIPNLQKCIIDVQITPYFNTYEAFIDFLQVVMNANFNITLTPKSEDSTKDTLTSLPVIKGSLFLMSQVSTRDFILPPFFISQDAVICRTTQVNLFRSLVSVDQRAFRLCLVRPHHIFDVVGGSFLFVSKANQRLCLPRTVQCATILRPLLVGTLAALARSSVLHSLALVLFCSHVKLRVHSLK